MSGETLLQNKKFTGHIFYHNSDGVSNNGSFVGFNMVNCTDAPKFSTRLTLVYNFVQYTEANLKKVGDILKEVNKVYPGIAVIAAVPSTLTISASSYKDVTLTTIEKRYDAVP